ncbi:hypothetical protein Hanom_Chr13g01224331 [Helianthus anomalus]
MNTNIKSRSISVHERFANTYFLANDVQFVCSPKYTCIHKGICISFEHLQP